MLNIIGIIRTSFLSTINIRKQLPEQSTIFEDIDHQMNEFIQKEQIKFGV